MKKPTVGCSFEWEKEGANSARVFIGERPVVLSQEVGAKFASFLCETRRLSSINMPIMRIL